jgi:hypothetical protein
METIESVEKVMSGGRGGVEVEKLIPKNTGFCEKTDLPKKHDFMQLFIWVVAGQENFDDGNLQRKPDWFFHFCFVLVTVTS